MIFSVKMETKSTKVKVTMGKSGDVWGGYCKTKLK